MKRGNQKKGHCHSKYIFHPWTKISSSQTCQSCADTKPKDSYPNGFLAKPGRPSVRLRDFALAPPLSNPFCVLYGRTLLPFKSFTLSPARDDLGLSTWDGYLRKKHVVWIVRFFLKSQIHRKKASEKHLSVKTLPPLQQQKDWVYRKFPDKTKHVMILVTQHEVTRSFSTSCRIIEKTMTQIICILQNITQKHWHTSRRKLKPFLKGSWVRGEWFLWWLAPHCFGRLGTKNVGDR